MNRFNIMWRGVNPSSAEIEAASAAFEGLDVTDIVPRLVMVRRAVAARFYTDELSDQEKLRLHEFIVDLESDAPVEPPRPKGALPRSFGLAALHPVRDRRMIRIWNLDLPELDDEGISLGSIAREVRAQTGNTALSLNRMLKRGLMEKTTAGKWRRTAAYRQ
jgi:hypothetical protein